MMRFPQQFCVFSLVFLMGPVALAHPGIGLPEVSQGSNPYRVFGGEIAPSTTSTIFTVPDDQEFIITMVRSNVDGASLLHTGESADSGVELLSDGVVILTNHAIGSNSRVSIAQGEGKLPVAAGAVLSIINRGPSSTVAYYIQGYLIEAGSPYRSFMGHTPLAISGLQTAMTADADRDFLVRTLAVRSAGGDGIDLYMDGALLIEWDTATHGPGDDRPLWAGRGMLLVPAGSSLQLRTNGYFTSYYIDGEYIRP
jgi:hypothetical protein